jgi:hypothetical protein
VQIDDLPHVRKSLILTDERLRDASQYIVIVKRCASSSLMFVT